MASFHQEKGHPHVHLMYYTKKYGHILEDFISPKRFEILSERIRVGFNKSLYKNRINEKHKESDSVKSGIRDEILSMFYELNDTESLNYNKVSDSKILSVDNKMYDLLNILPQNGNLRFKHLDLEI